MGGPPERDKGIGMEPVPAGDPEVDGVPERDKDLSNPVELEKHIREVTKFLNEKRAANTSVYVTSAGIVGRKRMHEMMMDSGANISMKGKAKGEASILHDVIPTRYVVQGTAGSTETAGSGTVIALAKDENGEEYEFRFECSEVDGMGMNLLAVSRLTNRGAVVHLQKGNSYVLFPQENGKRRKILLLERNGLFILALEVEDATPNETTACPAVTKDVHGPAATMNLWHKRLGCSKAKIGFMNKQAVGEGMNIR